VRTFWAAAFVLAATAAGRTDTVAPALDPGAPAAARTDPATEASAEKPDAAPALPAWLADAQALYQDALKAQEDNDPARAEKKLRAAFKALSKAPSDVAFLDNKKEFEDLLGRLEERFTPPAPGEEDGLNVTEQELDNAPAVGTPSVVENRRYSIPIEPDDPLVKKYIAVYTGRRRGEMEHALERMGRYSAMIEAKLKKAGLPRELLYLPIVESEFKNTNVSHAGAVGLWQFMEKTGRGYGLKVNYWVDERRDPEKATDAAVKYLKNLHQWFDDWHLALAGYNRGEYGVARDMETTRSPGFGHLSERRILPSETEQYVPKFMACVIIADNAATYGFQTAEAKPMEADEVVLGKPIDLKVAAKAAGVTEETLKELNPTLRVWCTPKNDPNFALRLPAGTKAQFLDEIAKVQDWTPGPEVVRYKIRKGDVLGSIAKKHKTTVEAIRKDNKIKDPRRLRPGQTLIIRPGLRRS